MVEDIDISKYNLDESLDLSSFEIQNKLNPKFWKNDLLDSRIRLKLLDIADDFTDFLKVDWVKPEDITMTGSLANYNWSEEYSDIDLHIIMDFKKVDKRVDFVREYFQSKKDLWNQKHKDIRILNYPVELYVQDKNEPHSSSGIYSLEKNDWIVKPERKEPTKKNLNQAEKDAEKWMDKIDSLIDRYYPDEIESEKERILKKLDNTFSKIKDSRRQGFSKKNDEMNKNNLTFKMLRRNGYLDKLSKKKNEIYDDLMSINEESFGSRVVKNKKLYSLLKREGLDGIELVKGPGYFYIDSHNPKMECAINSLGGDNKIFICSFNHQPVEVWVQDIKSLIDDIDWDYVNSLYNERPRYKLTVVNENESNNTSNKLYHQTTNDINVIKSIIKNGLIPQNKNDEGKGIWFSEEPFYDVRTTTFSIPNNDESLRKYNFNTIFDGDIKIARNFIPFNELTVENIPFAIINDNAYLFSSSKKFLMSMANKKGYNNIAEYLSNNKNFNSIVIFKDLFEKYVESGTSHIFNKYPNVKIINLFE